MKGPWLAQVILPLRALRNCALLAFILASGCAHNPPSVMAASAQSAPFNAPTNQLETQSIASLNAIANDNSADPDQRCLAIFSLFQQFVKSASTPSDISAALTDTRWLEKTNIHGFYVLSGWIPVNTDFGTDMPFVVAVLPSVKPSTGRPPNLGYHIYFTLAGRASRSEESAFAILTGQANWDTKALLQEFALCYPDGTIERTTKSGSRKFNMYSGAQHQ
jgi:hypothetical protein